MVSVPAPAHRVTEKFNRRLRHVRVVVGRKCLAEILEFPGFFFAGLDVLFELDSDDIAKFLESSVWARSVAERRP